MQTLLNDVKPGARLSDVLAATVSPELLKAPGLVVLNHGAIVANPAEYFVQAGDRYIVGILPQGGGGGEGSGRSKSIGQIVVGIVLVVVGLYTSWAGGASLVVMGAGMILGGVAGLLIKPPSVGTIPPSSNTSRESAYYGITGQSNTPRAYQPVLKLYGRYKMFPALAANPIITNIGVESYISAIYDFGIGNVLVEDILIGDTPADQFAPELRLHSNVQEIRPELANRKVNYDQFSYVLQQNAPLTLKTDSACWLAELDLMFSQGLVNYSDQGNPGPASVSFDASYRRVGAPDWVAVTPDQVLGMPAARRAVQTGVAVTTEPGEGVVQEHESGDYETGYIRRDQYIWNGVTQGWVDAGNPLQLIGTYYGVKDPVLTRGAQTGPTTYSVLVTGERPVYTGAPGFVVTDATTRPKVLCLYLQFPEAAQYEIQITRLDPVSMGTRLFNSATVTTLKSSTAGDMFALKAPHTMLEMRLLASEKLSGVVQNLSAICTSILPRYDANGVMIGETATRNPAWIALDVLVGPANARPLPLHMIDWPSWVALAIYCDEYRTWQINGQTISEPRHTCDVVIDYAATGKEIVESILSCCRANVIRTQTGLYGVAIDQIKAFPRQLVTPSNSWDFAATRSFSEDLHGLRVSFIDNTRQYQRQEIIVYKDGYDATNASRLENLGTFGVTDWFRAWAFGRFMLAQTVHRSEAFTVKMDIEHLAFQRGDLIHFQHDVPKLGGFSTRVVSVAGDVVTVGQELSAAPSAYSVRLADGTIRQGGVLGVLDPQRFTLDSAAGIAADDLIVLGMVDRVVRPYLVMSIEPQNDIAALVALTVYEPLIYDADIGALPPWNPAWGDDLINASDLRIVTISADAQVVYENRKPFEHIIIDFTVDSPFYGYAEVYLNFPGKAPRLIERTETLQGRHSFSLISSEELSQSTVDFTVIPFTGKGLQGVGADVSAPMLGNPLPNPPEYFDLDVKRETITLKWSHPYDEDVVAYQVLYDPRLADSNILGATLLAPSIAWPTASFEVPLRIGTYFIRSIDSAGQYSLEYAAAFTPTEFLWGLNVIAVKDDAPAHWPGMLAGFDRTGSGAEIYTTLGGAGLYPARAEYYYSALHDNGDIFQTRLTSKIIAHDFNESSLMASWLPLASADPLAGHASTIKGGAAIAGNVDVYHEVRWVETYSTMVSWLPLASAAPIGFGSANFGPWRRFQVGEYTGRYFQFRLVAEYVGAAETPDFGAYISGAKIEIDMPDRTAGEYNVQCLPGQITHVQYVPAFKDRPFVSITPGSGTKNDEWQLSNQTARGFDIEYTGTASSPQFDWLAKGYGAQSAADIVGNMRRAKIVARDNQADLPAI